MGKLTKEIVGMEKMIYEYGNKNVAKYANISDGTKKQRIKALEKLVAESQKSIDTVKNIVQKNQMAQGAIQDTIDMSQEVADYEAQNYHKAQRGEDGDYAHTKEMSNAQIMQHNKNQFAETDNQLDKISAIVGQIAHENENFRDEVKLQNKMLDKVNEDIDANIDQMVKLDSKLKKLLAKGSICWLWMFVILELAVLVTILILMSS